MKCGVRGEVSVVKRGTERKKVYDIAVVIGSREMKAFGSIGKVPLQMDGDRVYALGLVNDRLRVFNVRELPKIVAACKTNQHNDRHENRRSKKQQSQPIAHAIEDRPSWRARSSYPCFAV